MTNGIKPCGVVSGAHQALIAAIGCTMGFAIAHRTAAQCQPWSILGNEIDGNVLSIVSFEDDGPGPNDSTIFTAGVFSFYSQPAKRVVHNVAKWSEPSWLPLGDGVNGQVNALAAFDADGAGLGLPVLIAGGDFYMAGGVAAANIAKWDGSSWSALGSGMNGPVDSLTVIEDDIAGLPVLCVGGHFTNAGGVSASHIARWNGSSWSALGAGVNGVVRAMTVFDEDGAGPSPPSLFAAGDFTTAGGVPASHISKWNGSSWSGVGGGMDASALALASFDDDGPGPNASMLYAAGVFDIAGGQPASRIARWNGLSWLAVGSGIGGVVVALTVFDDDGQGPGLPALFVAGQFTQAGGLPALNVARWDGSVWSLLGDVAGASGAPVLALANFEGEDASAAPPALLVGWETVRQWRRDVTVYTPVHSLDVCAGQDTLLSATARLVTPLTATFQWSKDGIPLSNSPRIHGALSPILSILDVNATDAGVYEMSVTTFCGSAMSDPIQLIVGPGQNMCPADLNGDGDVNGPDLALLLGAWGLCP